MICLQKKKKKNLYIQEMMCKIFKIIFLSKIVMAVGFGVICLFEILEEFCVFFS